MQGSSKSQEQLNSNSEKYVLLQYTIQYNTIE